MTSTTEHGATPGPLRLHDMERATIVAGSPGAEIANCCNGFGDQEANAAEIVKRWNAHADLVTAAKRALATYSPHYIGLDFIDNPNAVPEPAPEWVTQLRAAIAKAAP